jgi:hypothetical protein
MDLTVSRYAFGFETRLSAIVDFRGVHLGWDRFLEHVL